jgi:hypothetical protein
MTATDAQAKALDDYLTRKGVLVLSCTAFGADIMLYVQGTTGKPGTALWELCENWPATESVRGSQNCGALLYITMKEES